MGPPAARAELLLKRVPDARRGAWPLFPAAVLPYVALMLGVGLASLLALSNALAVRRARPALVALLVGVVGWIGFGVVFVLLVSRGGLRDFSLAVLPARLFNVGLGTLLAWSQWSYVRGHEFLDGRTIPLLHAVLVAFVALFILPGRVQLVLEGLWVLLLR